MLKNLQNFAGCNGMSSFLPDGDLRLWGIFSTCQVLSILNIKILCLA